MFRFIYVTCLIDTCAMTCSYMCHDAFIPFLRSTLPGFYIHICDVTHSHVCHNSFIDSFIYVPWRIHTFLKVHSTRCLDSYMWRVSFTRVPWHIHMCANTTSYLKVHSTRCLDSYMWRVSFTRVPWTFHTCTMAHSHVSWGPLCQVLTFTCVAGLICMCAMFVWKCATWLRL